MLKILGKFLCQYLSNKSLCIINFRRKKYTIDDEKKMANYLMKGSRYKHVGGNVLWKNMELAKVSYETRTYF